MSLKNDPIYNAIYNGINKGIRVTLDNECFGSAVILIYAGIEAMATLARPADQIEVRRTDFVNWIDRYIQLNAPERISGEEFYSARCAVMHNFGVENTMTHSGSARMLGYVVGGTPPVHFCARVSPNHVLVDILAFAEAFFKGVDGFLIDAFSDPQRSPLIERRLQDMLCVIPPG